MLFFLVTVARTKTSARRGAGRRHEYVSTTRYIKLHVQLIIWDDLSVFLARGWNLLVPGFELDD